MGKSNNEKRSFADMSEYNAYMNGQDSTKNEFVPDKQKTAEPIIPTDEIPGETEDERRS